MKKIKGYIRYPRYLDLKKYCKLDNDNLRTEYELTGVVVHWGSLERGHYVSIVKKEVENKDKWYYCNDKDIAECQENQLLG